MALLDRPLSPIGFGAFMIGRNQGIKYPRGYDLPDAGAAGELLNGVLDLGINQIDTAPAYGLSEERIGQSIAHRRGEFLLSTKVGETFDNGASVYDYSENAVRESIHRSLRRLRTDVLDLVYVHSNGDDLEILEHTDVVSVLHDLRDKGLIKAVGWSGYTAAGFRAALAWVDAIMVTYNREDPTLEPIIGEAAAAGLPVMVKKGLASGKLDPADAISFVLRNSGVTSLMIGALSVDHMRDNYHAAQRVRGQGAAGEQPKCQRA